MKSLKFVGLSVLVFAVMVVGRAYGEDMKMDMKDMKMPAKETTAEKKASAEKSKEQKEIWECSMKDYCGAKTKDYKCPKCGMKLQKKMVIRGLKKAELGKEYICPVTGEKFKGTKETKAADYKGKSYYFCCEDCPDKFIADPDKYIRDEKKATK